MKKRIAPYIGDNSRIYLYEGGGGGFYWKISMWYSPTCSGYMVRCGLPGSECSSILNPTCIP